MKTAVTITIAIMAIPIALFIGKTKIDGWNIEIERPVTAIFFYITVICALLESK